MFKNAEKIDPFDNFDWNSGRSHKGRIMKIFAGNGYSRQCRLNGKIGLVGITFVQTSLIIATHRLHSIKSQFAFAHPVASKRSRLGPIE